MNKPKPFSKMLQTTCEGCRVGWTFMGTGYCGPCLEKLDAVPEPIPMRPSQLSPTNN